MMRLKFITYATPDFIQVLGYWVATVHGHGLDYHYAEIKDQGSWRQNSAYRGQFMWEMAEKFTGEYDALVWIDADALVLKYPSLFFELNTDLAWRCSKGTPMGGTLFVRLNDAGQRFVAVFRKWCKELGTGKTPCNNALAKAHQECPISHTELPYQYGCFYRERPELGSLVIAHFRATKGNEATVLRSRLKGINAPPKARTGRKQRS